MTGGAIILIEGILVLIFSFLGVAAILTGVGILPLSSIDAFLGTAGGEVFLLGIGAVLIVVGIYFLIAIYRVQAAAARFAQDGEGGRIEISPGALREFVSVILRQEIKIDRFRVKLRHMEDGIGIQVETTLSGNQQVGEVSRKIQEILAERIQERTGVAVHNVSVLVRGIRTTEKPEQPEAGEDER